MIGCDKDIDNFLSIFIPSKDANFRRRECFGFVQSVLEKYIESKFTLALVGSSAIRCYLPEGDLDVVLFTQNDDLKSYSDADNLSILLKIFQALCSEIASPIRNSSFVIRNVEFINARTPLASCKINNINVDITVNQLGSILSATFIENMDILFERNHLFKKSILLVKNWCVHEASKYAGCSILSSKDGMLSSYAVSIMVLVVMLHASDLEHVTPFDILGNFLNYFSKYPWEMYAISINGNVDIESLRVGSLSTMSSDKRNIFLEKATEIIISLKKKYEKMYSKIKISSAANFSIRSCNIVDPLNVVNNLGYNISRQGLQTILNALAGGSQHFSILKTFIYPKDDFKKEYSPFSSGEMHTSLEISKFIVNFFPVSRSLYLSTDVIRADLRFHPLQVGTIYTNGMNSDNEQTPADPLIGDISGFDIIPCVFSYENPLSLCEQVNVNDSNLAEENNNFFCNSNESVDLNLEQIRSSLSLECPSSAFEMTSTGNSGNLKGSLQILGKSDSVESISCEIDVSSSCCDPNGSTHGVDHSLNRFDTVGNLLSNPSIDIPSSSLGSVSSVLLSSDVSAPSESSYALCRNSDENTVLDNSSVNEKEKFDQSLLSTSSSHSSKKKKRSSKSSKEIKSIGINSSSCSSSQWTTTSVPFNSMVLSGLIYVLSSVIVFISVYYLYKSWLLWNSNEFVDWFVNDFLETMGIKSIRFFSVPYFSFVGLIYNCKKWVSIWMPSEVRNNLGEPIPIGWNPWHWVESNSTLLLDCNDRSQWIHWTSSTALQKSFPTALPDKLFGIYSNTSDLKQLEICENDVDISFQWYRDGVLLPNSDRGTFLLKNINSDHHTGTYSCLVFLARTYYIGFRSTIRVAEPPKAMNRRQYIEIVKGNPLLLGLQVKGNPYPSTQWYRNGYLLANQRSSTLSIPSVQPSDSGTYTCVLENIVGQFIWVEATVVVK